MVSLTEKNNSTFGESYYISKKAKKAFDGQTITRKYKEGNEMIGLKLLRLALTIVKIKMRSGIWGQ